MTSLYFTKPNLFRTINTFRSRSKNLLVLSQSTTFYCDNKLSIVFFSVRNIWCLWRLKRVYVAQSPSKTRLQSTMTKNISKIESLEILPLLEKSKLVIFKNIFLVPLSLLPCCSMAWAKFSHFWWTLDLLDFNRCFLQYFGLYLARNHTLPLPVDSSLVHKLRDDRGEVAGVCVCVSKCRTKLAERSLRHHLKRQLQTRSAGKVLLAHGNGATHHSKK